MSDNLLLTILTRGLARWQLIATGSVFHSIPIEDHRLVDACDLYAWGTIFGHATREGLERIRAAHLMLLPK